MNQPGLTQLIVILGYLSLLLLLGVLSSRLFRGTRADYQLASHTIGPFLLLMSLFGTTMTAFALVGSSGEAFEEGIGVYGMMASSSGIIHSLCFFLIGVRLWKLGRRHGYATQISFFRDRLDSELLGILLFPILVGLVVPYLLIGVIGAGAVIREMTAGLSHEMFGGNGGLPPWIGSLIICSVVLIYVFVGGMRGTAWANTFQTLVFMVLGVVTFVVIANRLGGEASFFANLQKLGEAIPDHRATRIEMSKTKFLTYLLVPLSVGMFPHLFQHWLTAKSANSFKLPVICHPLFIMIVWVPCVLVGVWATTDLLPTGYSLPTFPGTDKVNPNRILPSLVNEMTPPLLGGLLAAGILAAIMSSLDSQFLCLGTIFNNDIVNHYLGHDRLGDRKQVWITRLFIVLIVAVTYLLSLRNPASVFAVGVWCFSGFASLFPLVFAALYWRRLTAWGAIAGVLAMFISWMYLFSLSGWGAQRDYSVDLKIGAHVYQLLPVLPIFLCSLVTMVVVSLVTPPPRRETLAKFFTD
jgi:solute:Na+ symporter, SSS family